jgi:hypothetical protein
VCNNFTVYIQLKELQKQTTLIGREQNYKSAAQIKNIMFPIVTYLWDYGRKVYIHHNYATGFAQLQSYSDDITIYVDTRSVHVCVPSARNGDMSS